MKRNSNYWHEKKEEKIFRDCFGTFTTHSDPHFFEPNPNSLSAQIERLKRIVNVEIDTTVHEDINGKTYYKNVIVSR